MFVGCGEAVLNERGRLSQCCPGMLMYPRTALGEETPFIQDPLPTRRYASSPLGAIGSSIVHPASGVFRGTASIGAGLYNFVLPKVANRELKTCPQNAPECTKSHVDFNFVPGSPGLWPRHYRHCA
jgi:hypothetical protein